MWYKVNELWKQGLNKSQISRELEIDRGTVRKYLAMDEQTFMLWINKPHRLSKKLSGYYKYVKTLLESTPNLSAAQVEDRLKESFEDLPKVDSKTVYNFVKTIREKHAINKYKEVGSRQYQKLPEVAYGSEAQVDFGEITMQSGEGHRIKVYFFAMVLSRSRYKYVYCQRCPFTTQTAVYAHELAFNYFNGIPSKIIYDQDKVFIKGENLGDVLLTEGFRSFCQQYSFETIFCRKADPESKGKVENVVKYVKYNFLKGRTFQDQNTLQEDCLAWLKRTANAKLHGTIRKVPYEQWLIEQSHLEPYRDTPEKPLILLPGYKVRKDNTVAYKGNFYSLPIGTYKDADTTVLLDDKGNTLDLLSDVNTLVASHKIPLGKGVLVRNTDHCREKSKTLQQRYELLLNAFGNTPESQSYLADLENDKPRYFHDNIREILKAINNANDRVKTETLNFCIENKVFNGYRFAEVLAHLQNEEKQISEASKINISKVNVEPPKESIAPAQSSIEIYETLLR